MFSKKQVQRTSDLSFSHTERMLDLMLNEQRSQRSDLSTIKRTLDYIIKIMNHQDTMDYFSKKYGENLNETSHQTELDEQDGSHNGN